MSTAFYETAGDLGGLDVVARACEKHGASLLLDAYHQLNVVPFSLRASGLESALVTGGGYKYCQLGEGNCFLRAPERVSFAPRSPVGSRSSARSVVVPRYMRQSPRHDGAARGFTAKGSARA